MARKVRPIAVTQQMKEVLDALTSIDPDSGCWEWNGYLNDQGYGRRTFTPGGTLMVHRVSYTRHKGPIEEGLVIDHLCRNRACINPDHLEAVTDQMNIRRGMAPGAKAQRREVCLRGHLYTEYGRQYNVRRYCAACSSSNVAAYRARKAEVLAA